MRSLPVQSVKRDLQELKVADFAALAQALKDEKISSLELSIGRNEKPRFTFVSPRHADAMFSFSRVLAWSISTGGWLQHLELGFVLRKRDLQLLVHALCLSKTLKHLSFANSGLGDANLRIMARGFRDCAPLQVLCLAGCNLTDAVAPVLASILKANLSRKIQQDWQNSLRVYTQKPSRNSKNAISSRSSSSIRCGLRALDLSWNELTVASVREMCTIFRLGPSIEALDVKGNNLDLESHKLLNDVMADWGLLKFVDLTESANSPLLGVLSKGRWCATTPRMPTASASKPHLAGLQKRIKQKQGKDLIVAAGRGECTTTGSDTEGYYSLGTGSRSSRLSDTKAVPSQQSLALMLPCCSPETAPASPVTPVTPSSLNLMQDEDPESTSWNHDDRDNNSNNNNNNSGSSSSSGNDGCIPSRDDMKWSTLEQRRRRQRFVMSSDATSTDDLPHWSSTAAGESVRFKVDSAAARISKADRNGFLADISRALLQLNDRIDKLVGPSRESDSLKMQLSSLI